MSELSIKINIAGRTYPLTIDRSEEEVIRKVADQINANVKHLKDNYAVKDPQDLLAMTALQLLSQGSEAKETVENEKMDGDIEKLNEQLESFLSK